MGDPPHGDHNFRPTPAHSQPVPPSPPRRRRRRRSAVALAAGGMAVLVGVPLAVAGLGGSHVRDARGASSKDAEVPIAADADTFVVKEDAGARNGAAPKLTAANRPDWRTESYIRFTVPPGAVRGYAGHKVTGARVEITFSKFDGRPSTAELRSLPNAGWSETTTTWNDRPRPGSLVATAPIATGQRKVSFDVGDAVLGPGTYAFAVTNPVPSSAISVHSRESGATGPRLLLSGRRDGGRAAAPRREASRTPATPPPISEPAPSRRVTGPTAPPARPKDETLCGASFTTEGGETFQEALARKDQEYGRLGMVRVFYPGLPPAWPGRLDPGRRASVVSFKLNPREVLDGRYDAYLRHWFATAPRDRDIYWVYYHEPEDNIAKGEFGADDYRAAWRRLRSLADPAGNPRLRATLVLMGWSLDPRSRRDWRDYYPGRDVVQVLGWDVYNEGYRQGLYDTPARMFDPVIDISRRERLPFGIAETGSHLVAGDRGDRRAAWLRDLYGFLSERDALWVAYFDHDWSTGDFRLQDDASRRAWRDFC